MTMRKILAAAICLLSVSYAWSQVEFKYRDLSTEDGLPSNYIINMEQDPQGYIWMATSDGLCRYDGYSFDVLRHTDSGNNSLLLTNRVRELHINPNGLLFIRLQGERYSCYDTNQQRFVEFIPGGDNARNYCDCIFTPEGDTWLWYTYTGCLEISYRDGKITSTEYSEKNGKLRSNNVLFIEPDSHHRIWIGTAKGLYLKQGGKLTCVDADHAYHAAAEMGGKMYFSFDTNKVASYGTDGRLQAIGTPFPVWQEGNTIRGLVPNGDKLWVVTEQTTYCYDDRTRQMTVNSLQVPHATVYRDNTGNYYLADHAVNIYYIDQKRDEVYTFHVLDSQLLHKRGITPYKVLTDKDGNIWIATTGNGLFVYSPDTRRLVHHSPQKENYSPIKSDYLYGLMADRSGNIWVSQENMGISVLTPMPMGVRRYYVNDSPSPNYVNLFRAVRQTSDGQIWCGNFMGGTYQLAGETLQKKSIGVDDDMLSVCIDHSGRQWVGTRNHGVFVNGRHYQHIPGDSQSLAAGKVFDILCDNNHGVWVAVNTGALCLAMPQSDGSMTFRRFLEDSPLMRNVTKLRLTRSGHIFVGCGDGIVVFDPKKIVTDPKAYHYYNGSNSSLGYFEIRDIYEDADGVVWLASAGGGVYKVKNPSQVDHLQFEQLTTQQGLADNTANAIIADRQGRLWIGTHYGLSCLDPKTSQFSTHYLSADKLGDVYSENSACMLADGHLVFGTNNGVVSFDPSDTRLNRSDGSHLAITNLLVNGIMQNAYTEGQPIRLSHHENSLTFRFSDMKFDYPHNTEYIYMLEGADHGWSQPTRQNEAVYKDLEPGTYTFHVRMSGSDKEVTLKVTIRQPWWNTWWAWLIYLLVVGGIAWYIIRLLLITYSMRNRIRMDKEISEFKQRFFMDVSHEFRTPLTLIQGSMERMRKAGELPSSIRQPISNMGRSTDRLMRLVNQLLDFDKYEHGKLTLRLQQTDVIRFLRDMTLSFSDMAFNRDMNLQFVPFAQHYDMFVDRGYVDKIMYNLLSNAFKYTPRKGDVTVRVKQQDHQLVIRVEDSGVGVPKEKQPQLFTRFMQTNLLADSIGIGLHFTHELVVAHHGEIHYEENPTGGSIFVVSIPDDPSKYQPEDYFGSTQLTEEEDTQTTELDKNYKEMATVPLNDRQVLIVEDDEDVREYVKSELSLYFKVITAQNGEEALRILKEDPQETDLIVSDIRMPIMDGIELLKRVRGSDELFDIPFILLSAIGTIEKQLQGARFGADAYLPKPFSPALLMSKSIALIQHRDRLKAAYSNIGAVNAAPTSDVADDKKKDEKTAPLITSERDRKFRAIIDKKIEANLSNPDLVVDDLAQSTGYGRSQFYSKMTEVTGKTPKDYIRMKRMERAAELLRSGEMITVAEVAYQVGFTDALYFSRCFKQYFGITPSKYQKG